MAIDYLHRLLITGSHGSVRGLAKALHREYPRPLGRRTWTEIVPFSFTALLRARAEGVADRA